MDNKTAKNILCIEDEPEMIELVRLILGRKGYEVIMPESVKKTIAGQDQQQTTP